MAYVLVIQRNAHLAGAVRLDQVNGREGKLAKAVLTAISNARRGSGEEREEEATAIQWTLWGKQAENAAEYLGKGSHVNIVGRVRNNNYRRRTAAPSTRWPSPARRSTTSTARHARRSTAIERHEFVADDGRPHEQPSRSGASGAADQPPRSGGAALASDSRSRRVHHASHPHSPPALRNSTRVLRSDRPLTEEQMRRHRAVDLRRRQARQPLRALHLHPDHRRPARPAQGRLRALHGRAGAEPHRRQDRIHQAHDPHAPCRPGQHQARGERDHPDQQPRRRELATRCWPACSASSAATAWSSATSSTTSASRTRATSRRGDRRRVPRARRLRGVDELGRRDEGAAARARGGAGLRDRGARAALRRTQRRASRRRRSPPSS